MKISINLINEYLDKKIAITEADKLATQIGSQLGSIEDIVDWTKKYDKAVIVKVVKKDQHPNADRLSVCLVDDNKVTENVERNSDGLVQVVCGAPNVVEGMLAVWLPPTATVPASYGTSEPFILESRELRGVKSNGMLAAPDELGLDGNHDGLLVVENGNVGEQFAEYAGLNDVVIELENKMFTHRPDCFGIMGVAREVAGIRNEKFESPSWYLNQPSLNKPKNVTLPFELKVETEHVPRFMAVALQNIKIEKSPKEIINVLNLTDTRPINNVVDLTNYFMHITGQPMHAYDYDKLKAIAGDNPIVISARQAKIGESLKLLGSKTISLNETNSVVICCNDVPIALGGVMGSADTEVDENTKNIILECANFDMYNIRRTSMNYGIFTDAVTRFNKGQSALQIDRVLAKAIEAFTDLTGASQASEIFDIKSENIKELPNVSLDVNFINVRLGSELTVSQIQALLRNVEIETIVNGDNIEVKVPFWRKDLEIPEDIVEEVGRLYGYHNLKVELPKKPIAPARKNLLFDLKEKIRKNLSSFGANEVYSYTFVHENLIKKSAQDIENSYKLKNALSPDLHCYRQSLTPSLLEKVHPNIKQGFGEFALFEINKVHAKSNGLDDEELPVEEQNLAFVFAADSKNASKYSGSAYYASKKYLNELFKKLGIVAEYREIDADISYSSAINTYDLNRSALIIADDKIVGIIGEFKISVLKQMKLPDYVSGFEIDLDQLLKVNTSNNFKPISKFPKIEQDITLSTGATTKYSEIYKLFISTIRQEKKSDIVIDVTPIVIFSKEDLLNYTFRIKAVSYTRTLIVSEINELLENTTKKLAEKIEVKRI